MVCGLRNSWAPISGFVSPVPASRAICSSLGRELGAPLDRTCADRLAGGLQLAPGPLGVRLSSDAIEHLMGDAQLPSCVETPLLAP
jgi:hypothetical protein